MNVNGSRYKTLMGETDWTACRMADPSVASAVLPQPIASPPVPPVPPLAFDAEAGVLGLRPLVVRLPDTAGETQLVASRRRAAAADRHGNIYAVSDDRQVLQAWPAGAAKPVQLWPLPANDPGLPADDFQPEDEAAPDPDLFTGLTVTEDCYLLAAAGQSQTDALLAFDLAAGGPPLVQRLPRGMSLKVARMVPRAGGGAFLLQEGGRFIWEVDALLRFLPVAAPVQALPASPGDFLDDEQAAGAGQTSRAPEAIDLLLLAGSAITVISMQVWRTGLLLLAAADAAGRTSLSYLHRSSAGWRLDPLFTLLEPIHDCVVAGVHRRGGEPPEDLLLLAPAGGNQLLGYRIGGIAGEVPSLTPLPDHLPCRLFGGRALVNVRGIAHYDSGAGEHRWVPVVQQARVAYAPAGELITPTFDSGETGCVWDRLIFDGAIPSGAEVAVWCRATDDDEDQIEAAPWQRQPLPRRRGSGSELPWTSAAGSSTGACEASFELLLQGIEGRRCQVRIVLSGEGRVTPVIRALRLWFPRFSYAVRFLPAVYREDDVSGGFLDRFLANFEGINTDIEGRIASVQALFDPRIAPVDALDWLASWFGIALDPAWEPHRRRLFIAHAMEFFHWRGTVRGLQMALALAFDPCADERLFGDPTAASARPQSFRVVEAFLTRRLGAKVAGDPTAKGGPLPVIAPAELWSPAEGNSGLCARLTAALGVVLDARDLMQGLSLATPQQDTDRWLAFWQANLGFVTEAGPAQALRWRRWQTVNHLSPEQEPPVDWPAGISDAEAWRAFCALDLALPDMRAWQDFLRTRYRTTARLNAAYGTSWPSFETVSIPGRVPQTAAAQHDWLQFERQALPIRRSAHRFSVLLPVVAADEDPDEVDRRLSLARRLIALEKPAHTVFDVRHYWALNRIGEARLGFDTLLGQGSRAPELIPSAVLGRAYLGASFVGGRNLPAGARMGLAC